MADNRTKVAPCRSNSTTVSRTAGPPAPVRVLRTHSTGESMRLRRQRPQRQERAGVRPVDVLEKDEQRSFRRGGANRALEVVHHPVVEVRRIAQAGEAPGITHGRVGMQGGREQREERHRLLIFEGLTRQRSHPGRRGEDLRLGQQSALADTRRPLDDQHTAAALHELLYQRADHCSLRPPARASDAGARRSTTVHPARAQTD